MQPRTAPHWTAPHWTTPPAKDQSLSKVNKALQSLQQQVDQLFEKDGGITSAELDALSKQVKSFYSDFTKHADAARTSLSGS